MQREHCYCFDDDGKLSMFPEASLLCLASDTFIFETRVMTKDTTTKDLEIAPPSMYWMPRRFLIGIVSRRQLLLAWLTGELTSTHIKKLQDRLLHDD